MSTSQEDGIHWMIEHFEKAMRAQSCGKILWGSRSIYRHDWLVLKEFIGTHRIRKVIEYGVGLSTELMLLEGVNVLSLETMDWWAQQCKKAFGANVLVYEEGHPPAITGEFDLAFVDGPKSKRTANILHAKALAPRYIYLHDKRPEEVALMQDWQSVSVGKYVGHFFARSES